MAFTLDVEKANVDNIEENSSASITTMGAPINDEEDRTILRKLDLVLMPSTAILLLLSFIDRSNVGNAVIAGMDKDLHLKGNQFNMALTIFYFSYIAIEIPSNLILKKVKPGIWLPTLTIAWGICGTCLGLVQNYSGLLTGRFFLGLAEGGLFPGVVLYLSMFYKRHELQWRMGLFYSAASMSGAFGGLLATAITEMHGVGGYAGWRWIFILEGLVTIVFGIAFYFILPSSLATAKFLSPEQRQQAVARYNADQSVALNDEFHWVFVRRGIFNPNTWLISLAYICILSPIYSYSLFLPTIVKSLGHESKWTTSHIQLLTVPPYVAGSTMTIVVAYFSDKFKKRGASILSVLPLAIIGYALSVANTGLWTRYAAVFLMAMGSYPCVPGVLAWLSNNMNGHFVRASASAMQLMIGNSAGFIATWTYLKKDAPSYKTGHSINLGLVCAAVCFTSAALWYNVRENKIRARGGRDERLELPEEEQRKLGYLHPKFKMTI